MMRLTTIKVTNPDNLTAYPYSTPLFQNGFTINLSPITIIVGENGVGKSTLLEGVAQSLEFPLTGGKAQHTNAARDLSFILNYHKLSRFDKIQLEDALADKEKYSYTDSIALSSNIYLSWAAKSKKGAFIRSEMFANLINMPSFASATSLSHGEGLINVLQSINDDGVYILDEPEAGLSPLKVIELMAIIQNKTYLCNSQFIISTHSPILMLLPEAKLLAMTENSLSEITPQQTSHFALTKQILNNSEEFIDKYFKN